MSQDESDIPPDAREFARQGQIIEAIKAVRERTGLGLKEAKEAVEAYIRDPQATSLGDVSSKTRTSSEIPGTAVTAMENGQLLEAIKRTREATGLGLKDAKEAVERYLAEHPEVYAKFKSSSSPELRRVVRKMIFVVSVLGLIVLGYLHFFGATS